MTGFVDGVYQGFAAQGRFVGIALGWVVGAIIVGLVVGWGRDLLVGHGWSFKWPAKKRAVRARAVAKRRRR